MYNEVQSNTHSDAQFSEYFINQQELAEKIDNLAVFILFL